MVKTVELYNALKDKFGEWETRALIDAIDEVADKGHTTLATKEDVLKTEMSLRVEIEKIRLEIEKVRADMRTEIEKVRGEIEKVRADVEKLRLEVSVQIEKAKTEMLRWQFIFWVSQIGATFALFRFFLK
ncbi:MAG: CCDC90 family protein [Candidatus Magnetoovum sp. WYHC-5]|nr:CCDC90 family protein [Candidatus Magnetoovum sp. WYHC-5]